jgi:guanosine-3',5'-bis(diphosphate) 3'-pyrophosphohydrolase
VISFREDQAREFAQKAHGDQKYGGQPYVVHLAAVRTVLAEFGFEGDYLVAAWLHDVLEDTKTSYTELVRAFGLDVAALVLAVTGVGENRKERNGSIKLKLQRLRRAIPLKLADRVANGRSCLKNNPNLLAMYQGEYPEFRAALYPLSDVPGLPQLCEPIWRELDRIMATGKLS